MDCKTARHQVALLVGQDLPEADAVQLQRHLATCPPCREQRTRLQTTFDRVLSVAESANDNSPGLWPAISSAIRVRGVSPGLNARQFNGWVAGLAVAATLLAMVTISQHLPTASYDYGPDIQAQPIGGPPRSHINQARPGNYQPPFFPQRKLNERDDNFLITPPQPVNY